MNISFKIGVIAAILIVVIAGGFIALNSSNSNNESVATNTTSNSSSGFKWYNDFDAAISEAQKTNKQIFAVFSASWCPACQQLESETLVDERIKQKISQNYVAVKIDVDTNPELSSKYAIYSIPAIVFMTSNGEVIKKIEGYQSPDQLLGAL
jgi:thiol:disulfide interchange protein DsbD